MCGGCDLLILLDFVIFVIKYHILTVNSFKVVLFKQSLSNPTFCIIGPSVKSKSQ